MRKRLLGVLLAVLALVLTVSVSSADLPGDGDYWIGATHQNVGDEPARVVVTAYDSMSNSTYPYTVPDLLAVGASTNVDLQEFETRLALPDGFVGSLVTSADQPLVALINVTNRNIPAIGLG